MEFNLTNPVVNTPFGLDFGDFSVGCSLGIAACAVSRQLGLSGGALLGAVTILSADVAFFNEIRNRVCRGIVADNALSPLASLILVVATVYAQIALIFMPLELVGVSLTLKQLVSLPIVAGAIFVHAEAARLLLRKAFCFLREYSFNERLALI